MCSPASFCWHCGGRLDPNAFAIVKAQGNDHRVHLTCKPTVINEEKRYTAKQRGHPMMRSFQNQLGRLGMNLYYWRSK